ncbi:uncharacterized protein (DUF2235 family) [Massilia sp. UYP11]|uniref:T6SS phospholipase effector Tle1-like catalytic domain-containing protein n=1 Tax=Massilia sp. UYP11 TaxID=1756385 RepID=UPI003D22EF1E
MKNTKESKFTVLPVKASPASQIKRVLPESECNVKKCENRINVGIFFDGTNNNLDEDSPSRSHTNIARLYGAYYSNEKLGSHRIYVPGVGTKFSDIGENERSSLGAGCAFGCEGRVIFGLLEILNFLHRQCYSENLFDKSAVLALCRNGSYVNLKIDKENLAKLGEDSGLLEPEMGDGNRRDFLTRQCKLLKEKLKTGKPRIVECFIDVFGFSRGAAEARVFCSWLNELLVGECLAGVPLRFRFVGIVDTVASAGFWSGVIAFATKSTGGHGAWASAEALRLPSSVKNCVHMVAMHELRRNFPLDLIGIDGKVQQGWLQFAYPGSHSDVGGGYRPGELGIAVGDDSQKLSQIPLNHMLECAVAAGAPITKSRPADGEYDPFAIHPDLAKAYEEFIDQATLNPRPVYEWLQPYLNWRWQIRDRFHTTSQVVRAGEMDRRVLLSHNKTLVDDANIMGRMNKHRSFGQMAQAAMKTIIMSRKIRFVEIEIA